MLQWSWGSVANLLDAKVEERLPKTGREHRGRTWVGEGLAIDTKDESDVGINDQG